MQLCKHLTNNHIQIYNDFVLGCPPLDLFFLVETSTDGGAAGFTQTMFYIKKILEKFLVGEDYTRVSLTMYVWDTNCSYAVYKITPTRHPMHPLFWCYPKNNLLNIF